MSRCGADRGLKRMRSEALLLLAAVMLALLSGCCTAGGAALGHAADVATRSTSRFPCDPNAIKPGGRVLVTLSNGREVKGRLLACRCEADSLLSIEPDRGASLVRDVDEGPLSVTPGEVRFVESLQYRWAWLGAFLGVGGDAFLVIYFFTQPLSLGG